MNEITVRIANWADPADQKILRAIRQRVFIDEQHVPVELEWDEFDTNSTHFIATLDDIAVSTARLKLDGQLGRMAVLYEYRQCGIGRAVLTFIIEYAKKQNYKVLFCHAQTSALDFYKRHGFNSYGNEFDDAGIPHRAMNLQLE